MDKLNVNAVYFTYQGEVNISGIGAPVIFVRFQGCHLRCYLPTLGNLCDTPEALDINVEKDLFTAEELFDKVYALSNEVGGIKLVTLTGGDPLFVKNDRQKAELILFISLLCSRGFTVSVETSGTLSTVSFRVHPNVHFVYDFKLKSCGVKQSFLYVDVINYGTKDDIIKFVVYDEEDFDQMLTAITYNRLHLKGTKIAVGTYWNGKLKHSELFALLAKHKLLGRVVFNFQAHKLITHADLTDLSATIIPEKL